VEGKVEGGVEKVRKQKCSTTETGKMNGWAVFAVGFDSYMVSEGQLPGPS
jgi:hypothetical protein